MNIQLSSADHFKKNQKYEHQQLFKCDSDEQIIIEQSTTEGHPTYDKVY